MISRIYIRVSSILPLLLSTKGEICMEVSLQPNQSFFEFQVPGTNRNSYIRTLDNKPSGIEEFNHTALIT
eukprot:SAG31_NODE_607_length_13606_cov_11.366699_9_plen_70_part_00